jgi:hypothetical protein
MNSARKIAHRNALASTFSSEGMLKMAFFPAFAHPSSSGRDAHARDERYE